MLELENPFWTFSLDVYAQPGVAEECLALQKQFGVDVNALLFCVWAAAARQALLNERQVAGIVARADAWQRQTVLPLRGVRQALKEMTEVGEPATALRKDVAAAELKAEQIEQAMLFAETEVLLNGAGVAPAEEAVPANVVCFLRRHDAASVRPQHLCAAALSFVGRSGGA